MRSPPLLADRANTMTKKSNLLYYCRTNVGSQALRRSLAVAHQLSDTFDVTLLSGDCSLEDVAKVSEIRCVQLPDLGVDPDRAQEDFNEAMLQNQRINRLFLLCLMQDVYGATRLSLPVSVIM